MVPITDFVALPVHPAGFLIIDLNAVHPHVSLAVYALGKDQRQGNKAPPIQRPALQNRKVREPNLITCLDHFLALPVAHDLWRGIFGELA